MQEKSLSEIKEGMVIGENVYSDTRQLLAARGTRITLRLIALLGAKGVRRICVEEDAVSVEKSEEIDERVDKKFKEFSEDPVMKHIAQVAKEYLKSHAVKR